MLKRIKNVIINNFTLIYILYYCTLFLDATSIEVDYPILQAISKIIRYILYIVFFIRLIFIIPEYKKEILNIKWKEKPLFIKCIYFILAIMFISLLINLVSTGNKRLLFPIFIIIVSYKTDYKEILKTTMILQIILTSITVLMSVLGVTQNYIVPRGSIQRNSLGFTYTTNLSQMILFSSIIYIYTIGVKVNWKDLFIIQLLNAYTYFLTNSRAEFILLEGIIFAIIFIKILEKCRRLNIKKIFENIKKIYSGIFSYTFILYPVLSFLIVLCYKFGGIWNKVNKLLSNRLKQTYDNIVLYGVHPFGKKIEFLGFGLKEKIKYGDYDSNFIDNEYLQMLLTEGLFFTICFIIMISIFLIILYKKRKYNEIIFCSIYLLFGLINPRIVNLLYCPILFMIIPTILEYKDCNEKIKYELN